MKIKQDYVSDQFHQVYFTFSAREMDEIILISWRRTVVGTEAKEEKYISELVMEKIEKKSLNEIMN